MEKEERDPERKAAEEEGEIAGGPLLSQHWIVENREDREGVFLHNKVGSLYISEQGNTKSGHALEQNI